MRRSAAKIYAGVAILVGAGCGGAPDCTALPTLFQLWSLTSFTAKQTGAMELTSVDLSAARYGSGQTFAAFPCTFTGDIERSAAGQSFETGTIALTVPRPATRPACTQNAVVASYTLTCAELAIDNAYGTAHYSHR